MKYFIMATHTFKQLLVWQKAHKFVLAVYEYTNSFPKTELYALTSQILPKDLKKEGKPTKPG